MVEPTPYPIRAWPMEATVAERVLSQFYAPPVTPAMCRASLRDRSPDAVILRLDGNRREPSLSTRGG
jgi:hypothetical protein